MNVNSTAFLVPTTSRGREWKTIEESYLNSILFKSMEQTNMGVDISVFVGYDSDDPIFSKEENQLKLSAIYTKFDIKWCPMKPAGGNVVGIWNDLCILAHGEGFMWYMVLGDDIRLPRDGGWLRLFQKAVQKNNYIGWAAGWSNNDDIATQFLIHDTHRQIYEFVYPPQLTNWYCDNWLFSIYPQKYRYWRRDYPLLNAGGTPRYVPKDDANLCKKLLKRHSKDLPEFLNLVNKIKSNNK